MKKYIILLIAIGNTIAPMDNEIDDFFIINMPPSAATCAQAAALVYENSITNKMLKNANLDNFNVYIPTNSSDTIGFRGIAFINHSAKQSIITYRGTELSNIGSLIQDVGIFFAESDIQDPYTLIHTQLRKWLWGYNKAWYTMDLFADYATKFGKYFFYYQTGGLGWLIQKYTNAVNYHKTALSLLAKIIGLSLHLSTESYIKKAMIDAQLFFEHVKDKYPEYTHYITGHSLGGFLAQIVGARNNLETYTFNAPGALDIIKKLYPNTPFNQNYIINFTRKNDLFGTFEKHAGITKVIPNYTDDVSIETSSERLWCIYEEKQYELAIQQYLSKQNSWVPSFSKPIFNPYVHKTKDGSYYFDAQKYLYQETSVKDYILENHSITNLANDLTLREKHHLPY